MAKQSNTAQWVVTAIVSIIVALIGAYAVMNSNSNNDYTPEIRIVDERDNMNPENIGDELPYNSKAEKTIPIPPSQKMVGTWKAIVIENNLQTTIQVTFKSDGTYNSTFTDKEGDFEHNGTWQLSNGMLFQQFSYGPTGKSKIKWTTNDKFELIIVDNGNPSYTGVRRIFQRVY